MSKGFLPIPLPQLSHCKQPKQTTRYSRTPHMAPLWSFWGGARQHCSLRVLFSTLTVMYKSGQMHPYTFKHGACNSSHTLTHTQSWQLFLCSQCRWVCRSDLMRCVCACVRGVIVGGDHTPAVLYNLSLPPISSPLSFQLSVYMYVFYSVNKMSHTFSILHIHTYRDNRRQIT